jgi:glycerol-3-phosphate dehydrogenase
MPQSYDVIIIGGGITGSMIARYLSRFQLSILLIERETDICMGTTAGNSAFVHAGYDPVPNSLKALTNVEGNALYEQLSVELGFDFERNGDYVVAIGQEEVPALERLMAQGKKNGVPGLAMIPGHPRAAPATPSAPISPPARMPFRTACR